MELTNLKKWQDKLNVCIRCGYCFEHCPIFKETRWEIDTPRGKLTALYGLLQNEIEPSDYIAEKIFECFYCRRCDNNCSAKVELTQIFTDARSDFIAAGMEKEGTTSVTDDDICSRCGVCIAVCKPEARSMDKENKKVNIDKSKCEGCGVCVAACPSRAITIKKTYGVSDEEILVKVKDFFGGRK